MFDCNSFSLFSRRLWVIVQCSRLSAKYLSRFLPWSSLWVIGLDLRSRKCKADLSLIFKLILCKPWREMELYEILNRLLGAVRWCCHKRWGRVVQKWLILGNDSREVNSQKMNHVDFVWGYVWWWKWCHKSCLYLKTLRRGACSMILQCFVTSLH